MELSLAALKDLAFIIFAGIGLFFTYRSWRQRQDEIHEKYFERRYELFTQVQNSLDQGINQPEKFEGWWHQLQNSRSRAQFLFGQKVKELMDDVFDALVEYSIVVQNETGAERVEKCKEAREKVSTRSNVLLAAMADRISVVK